MQINKDMITGLLRDRGDHAQAEQASAQLPDQVDTDQHGDILAKLGLSPQDLISQLGGGGGGGLGGGLGGLLKDL